MLSGSSNAECGNSRTVKPNWSLVGKVGEGTALQHIPLFPLPFQIGRRPGSGLCLALPQISKVHAELYERVGHLWVRDLGSTNGTYLNGARLEAPARVRPGDVLQFASQVFRLEFDDQASIGATVGTTHCDRALLLLQLDKLLTERAVSMHFQPIVRLSDRSLFGYEVLGRSHLFGLRSPSTIFELAAMFDLEEDVSRLFRSAGAKSGALLPGSPNLFLNTHPCELGTTKLVDSLHEIRDLYPTLPMTLEIHEAAVTSPSDISDLHQHLKRLNIGLAYDDFGAGQSRLLELVEVAPDCIKFDMGLIRGIDQAPVNRQAMLESLVQMVRNLGIAALAEGVETAEEHAVCERVGFDFGQGYYYGRPCLADAILDPRAVSPAAEDPSS